MKIERAVIVGGTLTPAGDGLSGASRCIIALDGGGQRGAIVKFDSIELVTAECFCALLLQHWGLNVPDAFVVDHETKIGFASADTGYPNLRQRMGVHPDLPEAIQQAVLAEAVRVAMSFKSLPLALAADEAIGNRDRNLGNILWDGSKEFWIDHALAVGNGEDRLPDLNKLATMAILAGEHPRVCKSAVALAFTMNSDVLQSAQDATILATGTCSAATYVADRLPLLASKLLARFPSPHDLLAD